MPHESTLRSQIEYAARQVNGIYIFVDSAEEIEQLLSIPGVQGVILPARNADLSRRFPDRVGWMDVALNELKLPERSATTAVGFLQSPDIGLRFFRALRGHGIRQTGSFSPRTGSLTLRSLHVEVVARIGLGVARRIARRRPFRRLLPKKAADLALVKVRDTTTADEAMWQGALARIDWLGKPILNGARNVTPGKVLLVTGSLAVGGSERQVVYTAVGLKRDGLSPSIVVTNREGRANFFGPRLEQNDVPVFDLPFFDMFSSSRAVHNFKCSIYDLVDGFDGFADEITRYAHIFEQERPAVVHTWLDWPNCAAGLAALAVGVPRIVLSGRSLSPKHFGFLQSFMRPAYQILTKSPRVRIINNSHAGALDYAEWLGIDPSQIDVVPNAIDPSEQKRVDADLLAAFREKHRLPPTVPVLGSVYRMTPEKRPMLWLDIAAEVAKARPDVRFVLVGGGHQLEAVATRARELGLGEALTLVGEASDVATPLATMSCFLLTSRVEGLPNVLLEAQLAGVPVVTSAVGGAPETIDPNGRAGCAVEGDDPRPYAGAILDVLDNPADSIRREELTASVLQRFGFAQMIARTKRVYGMNSGLV